ncbi:MAG TPA: outer membrane beta-barrel protein [Rhizomicrobium sp.]|nr:outer membrane beta-barrel protein [Rhizomicrobium sp.]
MTSFGAFTLSLNAFADAPTNSPVVSAPASNQSAGGPTVWNANQEISALTPQRELDPEYMAKGIPLGVFRLFPNLVTSVSYDDNVFRQPSNSGGVKDDFFFTEIPTLILDYETNEAHVDFYADGTFDQYARLTTVNTKQYDFGTKGTYQITRAMTFNGNISYSQIAEALSSSDTVASQSAPNLYTLFDVSGQFEYKPNRLGFTAGGSHDEYHFFNTPLFGGGKLYNHDRNNTIDKGFGEASYDFSPGYAGYVRATYNNDSFEQYYDRSGYHRDSHGYQVDAGVNLLLGNLVQGTVYLGYVDQLYSHQQQPGLVPLQDINGLDFGANLIWYPTELITVQLTGSRQIVNTTFAGSSGGDDRNVNLSANWELTRQIWLNANFGYDDTTYKGINLDETTPTFGVGMKYIISHYAMAQLSYQYATRDATFSGLNYNDNLVTLGLNLQI